MSILQIIILGIIQGLTEFLPVSSSGHLVLLPHFFNWPDQGNEMDVALHGGTLLAVLIYFYQDVKAMTLSTITYALNKASPKYLNSHVKLVGFLILSTIPAVIIGFILKRFGLDSLRNPYLIATTSLFFGVLLYLSDKFSKSMNKEENMTPLHAFIAGVFQVFAFLPGTSRSGACLTILRALQFERVEATRYAFLMSIPVITAAFMLTLFDIIKNGTHIFILDMIIATMVSFIVGYYTIAFFLNFMQRFSLIVFCIYRVVLGICLFLIF